MATAKCKHNGQRLKSGKCLTCYAMKWHSRNKAKVRKYERKSKLKRLYGISAEEYDEMFKRQGGKCFICSGPPKGRFNRLNVDHCHKTGKIRSLLCFPCNAAIGMAKEDRVILMRMAEYVSGDPWQPPKP